MRRSFQAQAIALALAIAAWFQSPATAAETVQDLLKYCSAKDGSVQAIYCVGRITGIADALFVFAQGSFCPKTSTTGGAEVQLFKNYATTHPEVWTQSDYNGVLYALNQKWPCI
ncbi:Rap1a/Tai family immunity protein [Mesorhizobium shangrilense]|uniref:Rap1a/Tai family immunity protein n=1 Tax=Mesorhizobium shangrilense TaxID=460060 RepID=A0ABV2DFV6_9HYPH